MVFRKTENLQIDKEPFIPTEKPIRIPSRELLSIFREMPLDSGKECFELYMGLIKSETWWKQISPQGKFCALMIEIRRRASISKDTDITHRFINEYISLIDDLDKITIEKWNEVFSFLKETVQEYSISLPLKIKPFTEAKDPVHWWAYFAVEVNRHGYTHEQITQEFLLKKDKYPAEIREVWDTQDTASKGVYAIEPICRAFLLKDTSNISSILNIETQKNRTRKKQDLSCTYYHKKLHTNEESLIKKQEVPNNLKTAKQEVPNRQIKQENAKKQIKQEDANLDKMFLTQIGDVNIHAILNRSSKLNLIGQKALKIITKAQPKIPVKYHNYDMKDYAGKPINSNLSISTDICYKGRVLKNKTIYIINGQSKIAFLSKTTVDELGAIQHTRRKPIPQKKSVENLNIRKPSKEKSFSMEKGAEKKETSFENRNSDTA